VSDMVNKAISRIGIDQRHTAFELLGGQAMSSVSDWGRWGLWPELRGEEARQLQVFG